MAKNFKLRAKLGVSEGKTIWRDVGIVVFDEEKGQCKVKLDLIPAGAWDGWIMGFPVEDSKEKPW